MKKSIEHRIMADPSILEAMIDMNFGQNSAMMAQMIAPPTTDTKSSFSCNTKTKLSFNSKSEDITIPN